MSLVLEREYNDERALANRFDGQIQGSLSSSSDIDWYTFSNPYPTQLSITFSYPEGFGIWKVQVLDEGVQVLSTRSIGPLLTPEKFTYTIPAFSAGNYFVRISSDNAALYTGASYTITIDRPSFTLSASRVSYSEGDEVEIILSRTGDESYIGSYPTYYKISGIDTGDTTLPFLEGEVEFSEGIARIAIPLVADQKTEGDELLVVEVGRWTGGLAGYQSSYVPIATAAVTVKDTSVDAITTTTHALTVLVDKGVLDVNPVLLKDLVEQITLHAGEVLSHVVVYNGIRFNFDDVDMLMTTVTRDEEFTDEFSAEIADFMPSLANITYGDAVALVGVAAIEAAIIEVAGADGNFVG